MQNVEATLADFQRRDVIPRVWSRDHTLWKPGPEEIADRLGWLDVTVQMRQKAPELRVFAKDVRAESFGHVVLLGMGGSSLGPEVLKRSFGSAPGYPSLIVLDSTVPAAIRAVAEAIDPAHTLFLVSSKSGGTAEPNALYRYFREQVAGAKDENSAGRSFAAITDEGSSLERLGRDEGFRHVFLNPSDIGGRYSVLSYFGLVPAALIGLDVGTMLDRADAMRESCAADVPPGDNPGAFLGALMGTLALAGRDKLTLVTSPSIAGFGLWAEQLIAESTGKEGKGIVPVAGEQLHGPDAYGDDRIFAYMRLEGDDNASNDARIAELEAAGHPVVRLELQDIYDLAADFFRWEFATAIAGVVLGLNPFDQPDVQRAKEQTEGVLREYLASGGLPEAPDGGDVDRLLSQAGPGDYLAIMAFVGETPETDRALARLREAVTNRYRIATTVGYGPRFLHSTGQLHKGGAANGLFLQIVAGHDPDILIPGEQYSFGVLADAQALGDLRALEERGRRFARVRAGHGVSAEIDSLAAQLQ
jgi:glucose-6-phosphate isomerase/transaldolase/glucose-6-phosphate isomerase